MRIQPECLHCLLRQVNDAAVMSGADTQKRHEIMRKELEILCDYQSYASPPHIAGPMHRCVREMSGCNDPYYEVKEKDMAAAALNMPRVEEFIANKEDKLLWALKAAACGNTLDSAANPGGSINSIEAELAVDFAICDIDILREQLKSAQKVLILADNSGETYFDLLLIKALEGCDVTYAVKACPAINDATIDIALRSGIAPYAEIISCGSSAPGTLLDEATDEFKAIFEGADLIISKGQGNYEALDDANRKIFYLFKVKCGVISKHFGAEMGKFVLSYR